MAIDATVGGADANSYITLVDADAYFANRLHTSTWDALTDPQKEAALIWATRVIEAKINAYWDKKELPNDATIRILSDIKSDTKCYFVWNGNPSSSTQALSWPRTGMKSKTGFDLGDDVIPSQLKDFQCELALKLAAEDRTEENAAAVQGLTRLKAGSIELGWKNEAQNQSLIPASALQLLVKSWWYAFELIYETRAYSRVL